MSDLKNFTGKFRNKEKGGDAEHGIRVKGKGGETHTKTRHVWRVGRVSGVFLCSALEASKTCPYFPS